MDDLKAAAVCMNSMPGEVDRNLDRIQTFVSEASDKGANIICFPEFSVTGYILKQPDHAYTRKGSGEVIRRLARMAQEAHLVLMAGMIEITDGEKPFITQVAAGPDGLVGLYRKTHLAPPERDIYQAGEEIKVYKYENTTLGIQLCYEAHFPELSTIMALMGAEVIFIPHASPRGTPGEKLQSWMRHLPGRAFDNSIFLVACNQVGGIGKRLSFPGVACVLGPDGKVLARYAGQEEKIIFAELKSDVLQRIRRHRMKYFIPHRRPGLYRKIIENA
jgi:N-carbamoylputrescine amidase